MEGRVGSGLLRSGQCFSLALSGLICCWLGLLVPLWLWLFLWAAGLWRLRTFQARNQRTVEGPQPTSSWAAPQPFWWRCWWGYPRSFMPPFTWYPGLWQLLAGTEGSWWPAEKERAVMWMMGAGHRLSPWVVWGGCHVWHLIRIWFQGCTCGV